LPKQQGAAYGVELERTHNSAAAEELADHDKDINSDP
jgi:hypothetical protein